MAIVASMVESGFGVNTEPHEPQKRLLSNISLEHVGHLIMSFQFTRINQSGTQVSHLRTVGCNLAAQSAFFQSPRVAGRLPWILGTSNYGLCNERTPTLF
jgi:hypothetical protein